MAERTTWSQKHTTDCRSVHCPCYRDGLDDQAVAAGPPAVQAGAEIAVLRAEVESLRTQLARMESNYVASEMARRDDAHEAESDLAAVRTDLSRIQGENERLWDRLHDDDDELDRARTDLSEARAVADVLAVHLKSLCYHADNFEHRYEGPGRACAGCYDALVTYEAWKT